MRRDRLQGDNFTTVGPWKITSGAAWTGWRIAALEACRMAAVRAGDEVAQRRFEAEARQIRSGEPGTGTSFSRGTDRP